MLEERRRSQIERVTAGGMGMLAVATVVTTIVVSRTQLWEEYYIYRLNSPVPMIREHAMHVLGEMQSERAVPVILDIWRDHWCAYVSSDSAGVLVTSLERIGQKALPELNRRIDDNNEIEEVRLLADWIVISINNGGKGAFRASPPSEPR